MRPKKRVLLYCADVVAGEQMAWMLEIRSTLLRVTWVASAEELRRVATAAAFDCVVVYRSELGSVRLAGRTDGMDASVFALLGAARTGSVLVEFANGLPEMAYSFANRIVSGKMPMAMKEGVAAVVLACERKRGRLAQMEKARGFSLAADRMVA